MDSSKNTSSEEGSLVPAARGFSKKMEATEARRGGSISKNERKRAQANSDSDSPIASSKSKKEVKLPRSGETYQSRRKTSVSSAKEMKAATKNFESSSSRTKFSANKNQMNLKPSHGPGMVKSTTCHTTDDLLGVSGSSTVAIRQYKIPKRRIVNKEKESDSAVGTPTNKLIKYSSPKKPNSSALHIVTQQEEIRSRRRRDSTKEMTNKKRKSWDVNEDCGDIKDHKYKGTKRLIKDQVQLVHAEERPEDKTSHFSNVSQVHRKYTSQQTLLKSEASSSATLNKISSGSGTLDKLPKGPASVEPPVVNPNAETNECKNQNARTLAQFPSNHNEANRFCLEEMDFDSPVQEILQMVTESDSKYIESQKSDVVDAMDMDVDFVPPLHSANKHLVAILDTNVWLDQRQLIKNILESFPVPTSSNSDNNCDASLSIVIPWMVLQEIDHNIHRNNASIKRREFQNAAKYIHSLLSAKDGRIKGQKATEAVIGMEFSELMADDSILNCAIQYDKLPQFITVFITNDINLLNKALVHNLNSLKADTNLLDVLRKLRLSRPASASDSDHIVTSMSFPSPSPNAIPEIALRTSQCTVPTQIGENSILCSQDIGMDIDDPMQQQNGFSNRVENPFVDCDISQFPTFDSVAVELRKALTHIIVPKMIEEYGNDGWKFAIKIKPPFTAESGFKCIQAHWIAVFSFLFPQKGKVILDQLIEAFHTRAAQPNKDELQSWRLNICKMALVFLSINDSLVKKPVIAETIKYLQKYIENERTNEQC